MMQILQLSFRNLVRQKRRNILLGIAIAFGAMVLILVNAYSHGISKVLFERIVRYTNGHASISYMRNGNMMNQVFHDDERIKAAIKKEAPEAIRADEAIGIFGRAIGNGVADNVIMVGVDLSASLSAQEMKEFESNFKMLSGSFEDLRDSSKGVPVVLAKQKADYLKVKVGDALRVRFTGVTNQAASAQLLVVGIFKPANLFMASPIFMNIRDLKPLSGYGPHDIATIQLNLNNPQKTAKAVSDRLHAALKPGLAVIEGDAAVRNVRAATAVMGMRTDSASLAIVRARCVIAAGDTVRSFSYEGVIMHPALAKALTAACGDTVRFTWRGKYGAASGSAKFIVSGIADSTAFPAGAGLLVNEREFYRAYYLPLPPAASPELAGTLPDSTDPLYPALAPEYMLMKRCKSTQEVMKVMREMGRARYKGIMVQVQSMYESASMVLNVEAAINMITFVAGLILFCIILIGVINTLRMTIRERTREIGTIRAIGMQKRDVRRMFLFETGMLALFASLIGTGLAFLVIWGLTKWTIDPGDNPLGMLLVDHHLYFAPTVAATLLINLLIIIIASVTAYFPARRASNLTAAAALRHIE
jgi:ABC-type lipoprotein release transport system permease subunit